MTIECGLRLYEIEGKETDSPTFECTVKAHWNRREYVVLHIGDMTVTVLASELKAAIENCTNTGKF